MPYLNFLLRVDKQYSLVILTALFLLTNTTLAQQPINKSGVAFEQALELYNNDLLLPSRVAFEKYLIEFPKGNERVEAKYFIASCAVKLSQSDGEQLMQHFVHVNRYHAYVSNAYLELGRHFYQDKKYEKVVQYYALAHENHAFFEEEDLFKYGYAQFKLEDYDSAEKLFKKLENGPTELTRDAGYFLGFIAHKRENLADAKTQLENGFESSNYGNDAIKLYALLLYTSNQYQELIDLIDQKIEGEVDGETLKMQSDAYFELEKYSMAAMSYSELFKKYSKFRTHESYYRAGVSYLKIQNTEESIDNLKRAALSKDTLGAYASYQLGILYTNVGNLVFATSSFSNAANLDSNLKKEAQYLEAKTHFDLKNYDESILLFTTYQDENPQDEKTELINEMLSEAYLNTSNHDRAIDYIESLRTLSPKTKSAYQRVTFLKGISLYNASRYHESIVFFQKSLSYATDSDLKGEAYYYIGEAHTRGKEYKDSKFYYEQAITANTKSIQNKARYGLAYAFFNLENYEEALNVFLKYNEKSESGRDSKYLKDALVRMGDCAYVLKEYDSSVKYYDMALAEGSKNKAYIHFQKGLVYRYSGSIKKAKSSFNVVLKDFSNSANADDALFQIGQMNFEKGEYESTVSASRKLIETYPDSKFLPFALLNEAVSKNNLGDHSSAIKNFTVILNRFPRHSTANGALLGLQELAGSGRFNDFNSYLEKYKKANPNNEAIENIEFETAKSSFFKQSYDRAITAFKKFKREYPGSALITDATYFIADSWFRKNNGDSALLNYYKIADDHDYNRYRRIQYRIASLEGAKGNFNTSNKYFLRLKASDGTFKDMNNAHFGLLSNHFALKKYDSAIYYGEILMKESRIPIEMNSNAQLLLGKSEYNLGNFNNATDWFVLLINDSPDARGAEAKYYISRILYENQEYNKSLQSLFELKDEYRSFDKWVGEAFLLMADIYVKTDELFQAKATLNSLIENVEVESIKEKAKLKLSELEAKDVVQKVDSVLIDEVNK